MLKKGDIAPDFSLQDDQGHNFSLYSELAKGPIVLYFYPKDFTAGCTAEACGFRDAFESFDKLGYRIVGISSDPPERHRKFRTEMRLQFTLLSDRERRVAKLYGSIGFLGIIPGRTTYVIGSDRIIRHSFSSQLDVRGHISQALDFAKGAE